MGKLAGLSNREIDAALARGRIARASELRAAKAHYDRKTGRMVVELTPARRPGEVPRQGGGGARQWRQGWAAT